MSDDRDSRGGGAAGSGCVGYVGYVVALVALFRCFSNGDKIRELREQLDRVSPSDLTLCVRIGDLDTRLVEVERWIESQPKESR